MKKALAGLVIAILFFAFGRNQPSLVNSAPIYEQEPSKQLEIKTPPATAAKEPSQTTQAQSPVRPLEFAERLASLQDSELFETLYSEEFKSQWSSALPTLKQRLFSSLPTQINDPELYEKEITARLGILKAFNTLEENNDQLKELLFSFIEHSAAQKDHPWILQREAAHTLTQNNDLTEDEQQTVATQLDPRARNTAAHPDVELIDRSIAGDQ